MTEGLRLFDGDFRVEFALSLLLAPNSFKLELLVENKKLESRLSEELLKFIKAGLNEPGSSSLLPTDGAGQYRLYRYTLEKKLPLCAVTCALHTPRTMATLTRGLISLVPGSSKLQAYVRKLMPRLKTLTETQLKAD
jgi:hypothetical protein